MFSSPQWNPSWVSLLYASGDLSVDQSVQKVADEQLINKVAHVQADNLLPREPVNLKKVVNREHIMN